LPILIGLIVIGVVAYILLGKKKSGNQNIIALIGERYSGKTQLFMRLNSGKLFETVPSIKNNHTSYKMPSSRKTYEMVELLWKWYFKRRNLASIKLQLLTYIGPC